MCQFEVLSVVHNQNLRRWSRYSKCRARMFPATDVVTSLTSSSLPSDLSSDLGELDKSINEFLLFHGTSPTAARSICDTEFSTSHAGSSLNKYGDGILFAESSSKADEYAQDDAEGVYQTLYAMLVCRVTCGRMLCSSEMKPDAQRLKTMCTGKEATYRSVLGDRGVASGSSREFVVFDTDQAYPEYIIIYRRLDPSGP